MITDEIIADKFSKDEKLKEAFLAGLQYERRASARLALSVNDPMAHAVGKLIRVRAKDENRRKYE